MEKILINENVKNHSFADINYLRDMLDKLPVGNYQVYVTKKPIRSVGLNAYYWGVIIKRICDETGQEPIALHNELKLRFNPRGRSDKDGNSITFGGSTKKENNDIFWLYCLRCILFALEEYGIDIPYPVDLNEREMLETNKYDHKNCK